MRPTVCQTHPFPMAEKEGFEPSIPFWGIHDFQSCALGQLRDFSMRLLASCRLKDSFDILLHISGKVKLFFKIQQKRIGPGVCGAVQVDGGGFIDRKAAFFVDRQRRGIVLADMRINPGNALPAYDLQQMLQ